MANIMRLLWIRLLKPIKEAQHARNERKQPRGERRQLFSTGNIKWYIDFVKGKRVLLKNQIIWVISHSSQLTSFYCLARNCKIEKNACAYCSKLYSKIVFSMDFFFNLWFQSFLLNRLTLCLITSFVCPSPLINLDEQGTPEEDDHNRKNAMLQEEAGRTPALTGLLEAISQMKQFWD